VRVYRAGASNPLAPVMTSPQDKTDGDPKNAIYDLVGNAMEWTAQQYREDGTGRPWSEAQNAERVLYAVRGLPPHDAAPAAMPSMPAAHRSFACGSGYCPTPQLRLRQNIGFRCTRETNRTPSK
jgi:formylglycine-generating enzyme required for sulfatase activity